MLKIPYKLYSDGKLCYNTNDGQVWQKLPQKRKIRGWEAKCYDKKETGMVKARSVYHIGRRTMIICSDTMAFAADAANGQVVEQTDATENETGVLTDAQSDQTGEDAKNEQASEVSVRGNRTVTEAGRGRDYRKQRRNDRNNGSDGNDGKHGDIPR